MKNFIIFSKKYWVSLKNQCWYISHFVHHLVGGSPFRLSFLSPTPLSSYQSIARYLFFLISFVVCLVVRCRSRKHKTYLYDLEDRKSENNKFSNCLLSVCFWVSSALCCPQDTSKYVNHIRSYAPRCLLKYVKLKTYANPLQITLPRNLMQNYA